MSHRSWPPSWLPPLAIVVVAFLWPWVAWGAISAWQSSQNRVDDWLPEGLPESKQLVEFFDRFGSDEFLMISWPGCQLDNPQADQLAERLVATDFRGTRYFASAQSGNQVLQSMITNGRLTRPQAIARLSGLFIGPDLQQTCVIALVSRAGLDDRRSAVSYVWQQARNVTGLADSDIHVAGTTVDSTAVDAASTAYLVELNAGSWLVCFSILWISLRRWWLVGTLFVIAIFNQQLSLALIYFTGGHIDSVQLLISNLCFVLSISAGLHFLGYFREAAATDPMGASLRAVRHALAPTLLAALTTSLGFASLCTSVLLPIRSFGWYSALLVPLITGIVILLLAIHSPWASTRNWHLQRRPLVSMNDAPVAIRLSGVYPNRAWASPLVLLLERSPFTLLILWIAIVALIGSGVTRLNTSVGTHELLSPDDKLIQDYAWLEQHIGALVPVELIVRFPHASSNLALPDSLGTTPASAKTFELSVQTAHAPTATQDTWARLVAVDQVRRHFTSLPEVTSSLSAVNFLPPLPQGGGVRNLARRALIATTVDQSRPQFESMRLFYRDAHEECWRISGRVAAKASTDYAALLKEIQESIELFQRDWPATATQLPATAQMKIDISGGLPFLYRTQRQMMIDLLASFCTAFLMIAAAMALLFRSLLGGLLTMLPNVTPGAVVFGAMGWLGYPVEIGTVLTASVMMGVCVDNTLHLVSHFRAQRSAGEVPREAAAMALQQCGGAMIQTGLICGVGMLVFTLSPFVPVARFAWLTFALLSVGALSDVILTPTLLLSPLHPLFYRQRSGPGAAAVTGTADSQALTEVQA